MKKGISPKELLKQQRALIEIESVENEPITELPNPLEDIAIQIEKEEVVVSPELTPQNERKELSRTQSKTNTRNQMTDAEVKGMFNQGELELVPENLQEFSERILGKSMSSRSMLLTDEFISTVKRYKDITGEKRSINEFINIFCYYGMSRLYDELKKSKEFKDWINMVK